jgi:protein TonB
MKNSHLVHTLEFNDHYFYVRLAIATVAGVAIAGLLTLFMHILIEFSQQELVQGTRANFLDFVRVKRDESSQAKKLKPQRPKTQAAPPAPPTPQNNQQNMNDAVLQVSIPTASANINVDIGSMISTGDGEYLPIVKVAPSYPIKASVNNIEGSCTVEYTVTTTGATKDIKVVPEKCLRVFTRTSIAAAKRFKYKPRIVNGEAIEVPNVRNRFEYELEDRKDSQ